MFSPRKAIAESLEDLLERDFHKFCSRLLDPRDGLRLGRGRLEGKDFLGVTDLLITSCSESHRALKITVDILREIGCNQQAQKLSRSSPMAQAEGAAGEPPAAPPPDKHFVDKHRQELIQRVSNIGPILDALLDEEVLQQEDYDTIQSIPTPQGRMRQIYGGPLKAGQRAKDVFFKILQKNEKYLIDDLSGSK